MLTWVTKHSACNFEICIMANILHLQFLFMFLNKNGRKFLFLGKFLNKSAVKILGALELLKLNLLVLEKL